MERYIRLINELIKLPAETQWVEFKLNKADPCEVGKSISALSNSTILHEQDIAYFVWGIDDKTHDVIGTTFNISKAKKGNDDLETWWRRMLSRNANIVFRTIDYNGKNIVFIEIFRPVQNTVQFKNIDYIRVQSNNKKLKDFPSMEVDLWKKLNIFAFEINIAKNDLQTNELFELLDYNSYFSLTKTPLSNETPNILHYLQEDNIIKKQDNALYSITNLGAVLFAKKMTDFPSISRKRLRVIQYKGSGKMETLKEEIGNKGYASGFEGLIKHVINILPKKEVINDDGLRSNAPIYPIIAIRELIANALIHQDFSITGTGPMIEIFDNRIEITNPGKPLVESKYIINNPPRSRNNALGEIMRRAGICEERGSGWDKIAYSCEQASLPAPKIESYDEHTKASLYSYIPFNSMTQEDRIWTCYIHACIKKAEEQQLTNTSLRNRFKLPVINAPVISKLIAKTVEAELIKLSNPNTATRYYSYVPFWA